MNLFLDSSYMLEAVGSPLVSIIIPIYNVENFLSECLDSVLIQTYQNYEVVLVDDGSTDKSLSICCEYKKQDSRIKVFSKPNGGLSSARNYGIIKSTGKYVIFLDPDDYWLSATALSELVNVVVETNCDIVRGEYKEVDFLGGEINKRKIPERLYEISGKKCSSYEFLLGPLSTGNFVWLFLIKRSTLSNCQFNEDFKFQEDIEFNIRYFATPKTCVYIPMVFYAYRKRSNSLTSALSINNLKYSFSLCDIFYEYSKKVEDENHAAFYVRQAIMMYYWTIETVSLTPLYQQRHVIIERLQLIDRNNRILDWIRESNQKFPRLIRYAPNITVKIFRFKNLVLRFYIHCKKTIKRICDMR